MSNPRRSTVSPTRDLKQRVITCINKLSDRDTFTMATQELESIIQSLTHDSFSVFFNCIYYTDLSQKPPVRKQCARLLGLVAEVHGNAVGSYLGKMVGNVVKRLRDSDSNVRSACVGAVGKMAGSVTKVGFCVGFIRPFLEVLMSEQERDCQVGAAMCLAAAIRESPDPDVGGLGRVLGKLVKLVKSDGFKGKAALLGLIGVVVGEVGVGMSDGLVEGLVKSMMEFLGSEDWMARKNAAEVLEKVGGVEKEVVKEVRDACLVCFEAKRFDKVKAVRDAMNRMLAVWKKIPGVGDEIWPPSQSKSCTKVLTENTSDGCYPNKKTTSRTSETPQSRRRRTPTRRLSAPATTVRQRSPLKVHENSNSALFHKLDGKTPTTLKYEIGRPHTPPSIEVGESALHLRDGRVLESGDNEKNRSQRPETKRALFDNKVHRFGSSKSGSRVVPVHQVESIESTVVVSHISEEVFVTQKNSEDLSLIRTQLGQIESQQSSLLDLLQRFMGSSQTGMQSLQLRVQGLELALDEICYDLAVSTGRMSNPDSASNNCCMLPSKFWRKSEGPYSPSNYVSSANFPPSTARRSITDRDGQSRRFRFQDGAGGLVVNPLADLTSDSSGVSLAHINRMPGNTIQGSTINQLRNVCSNALLGVNR